MDESDGKYNRRHILLVLFVSFLTVTLSSGGLFGSYQVLHKTFIWYYNQPEKYVSWIGTIQLASFGLSGLVAGPLAHRFGERPVIMAGSLSSALGLILSTFVPYNVLYLTFGVLNGFGLGMMNLGALTTVQKHFDRHRTLALASVLCGFVVGAFAWMPLTVSLLDCYSLRGTLLLLSAFQLQGLWCGALLKQASKPKEINNQNSALDNKSKVMSSTGSGKYELVSPPTYFTTKFSRESLPQRHINGSSDITPRFRQKNNVARPLSMSFVERRRHILEMEDKRPKRASLDIDDLIKKLSAPSGLDTLSRAPEGASRRLTSQIDYSENSLPNQECGKVDTDEAISPRSIFIDFIEDLDRPPTVRDRPKSVLKSGVKRYTWGAFESDFNAMDYKDYYEVIDESPEIDDPPAVVYKLKGDTKKYQSASEPVTTDKFIATSTGINLWTDISYVVFMLGSLAESMAFFTPLHFSSLVEDFDQVVQAPLAVSSIVVRLIAGVVGDRFHSQRCWICATTICVTGVLIACASPADHHVASVIYVVGLNIGTAFYLVLKLSILVDFWGISNVCFAIGHLFACTGLASLTMHPLSYFLVESSGGFSKAFLVYGCLQILGGCTVFITTIIKARQSV